MYSRITVKIGSNVLAQPNGTLDVKQLESLVEQVATLHKKGVEVILVSSGAVASGRSEIKPGKKLDTVAARQLFSAVGQAKLINHYYDQFRKHDIFCGQVLTTKENFRSRRHYLTMYDCMATMLDYKVIPIVNENDTVSVTELMFTDNDELSGLISEMMNAEALIMLSNIDGIFNGSPGDPSAQVIREIHSAKEDLSTYIQAAKSEFGRGGMLTKTAIAQKVAGNGTAVFIANGKKPNMLVDLMLSPEKPICTQFIPSAKHPSSVKKWIGNSQTFARGSIIINEGAKNALQKFAVSLLPVGVVGIEGEFMKDDVVQILDEKGTSVGIGKVTCDSIKARQIMGKKGEKELIHYNYLYLL
ncbi:MAG: glutamate 5-kinase [Prevotellaceae bacterium]|jgi:glutamate 5-kinase|nr:glutamate 5-kinase [Prevotellaceae bacterium]